jgi:hypothetical protein
VLEATLEDAGRKPGAADRRVPIPESWRSEGRAGPRPPRAVLAWVDGLPVPFFPGVPAASVAAADRAFVHYGLARPRNFLVRCPGAAACRSVALVRETPAVAAAVARIRLSRVPRRVALVLAAALALGALLFRAAPGARGAVVALAGVATATALWLGLGLARARAAPWLLAGEAAAVGAAAALGGASTRRRLSSWTHRLRRGGGRLLARTGALLDTPARGLVLALAVVAAARLFLLLHRYAVNLLYADQWDVFDAFFEEDSATPLFFRQHGPHFMGVSLYLVGAVNALSRWSTRGEVFLMWAALVAAAFLALAVKRRTAGPLVWSDAFLPLATLSTTFLDVFLHIPVAGHAVIPLVLLFLLCLAWTVPGVRARYAGVAAVTPLLTFTGMGVCAAPVVVGLLSAAAWRRPAERRAALGALAVSALALASFLGLFVWERAAAPGGPEGDPLRFATLPLAAFWGEKAVGDGFVALGLALLLVILAVAGAQAGRLLRSEDGGAAPPVVLTLVGFSLVFLAGLVAGRSHTDLAQATARRYAICLLPAVVGLYLHVAATVPRRWRRTGAALLLLGALRMNLHQRDVDHAAMNARARGAWKAAYLATGDRAAADRAAGLSIHPDPAGTHLDHKLSFLRERRLNLFADAPP